MAIVYELGPDMILAVIERRQAREDATSEGADGKRRNRRYTTKEERAAARTTQENAERERHAEFILAFSKLQDLDTAVAAGEEEAISRYLEIATGLIDSFRSTRQLFPGDFRKKFTGVLSSYRGRRGRKTQAQQMDDEADMMANRLERTMSESAIVSSAVLREADDSAHSRRGGQ